MRLKVNTDNGVWERTDETSDNVEELDQHYQEYVVNEVASRCKEDPSDCLPLLRRLLRCPAESRGHGLADNGARVGAVAARAHDGGIARR